MNNEANRLNEVNSYSTEIGILSRRLTSFYSLKFMDEYLPQCGSAVQMGYGDGYIAEALKDRFSSLTIVEGSEDLVHQAKSAGFNIVHSLFEDYIPKTPYDILLGNHILEHVENPVNILRKSKQWLHANSVAVFTVPNARSLHRRIGVSMGLQERITDLNNNDLGVGHRRVYTKEQLEIDILQADYTILHSRGYCLKVVSHSQMADWSKDLVDACFNVSLELPVDMCSNLGIICK